MNVLALKVRIKQPAPAVKAILLSSDFLYSLVKMLLTC